jgi:hypothetical protein|tara:strand:+ start:1272 stop:1457 length:186 start_codon:yes stop_codon:yes gene_type:complete
MTNLQKAKRACKKAKTLMTASFDSGESTDLGNLIIQDGLDIVIQAIEEQEMLYKEYNKQEA